MRRSNALNQYFGALGIDESLINELSNRGKEKLYKLVFKESSYTTHEEFNDDLANAAKDLLSTDKDRFFKLTDKFFNSIKGKIDKNASIAEIQQQLRDATKRT